MIAGIRGFRGASAAANGRGTSRGNILKNGK